MPSVLPLLKCIKFGDIFFSLNLRVFSIKREKFSIIYWENKLFTKKDAKMIFFVQLIEPFPAIENMGFSHDTTSIISTFNISL